MKKTADVKIEEIELPNGDLVDATFACSYTVEEESDGNAEFVNTFSAIDNLQIMGNVTGIIRTETKQVAFSKPLSEFTPWITGDRWFEVEDDIYTELYAGEM